MSLTVDPPPLNYSATIVNNNDSMRCPPNETIGAWRLIELYPTLLVDRTVTPIWYAVGIAGNVVAARIWLQRRIRRNNSSAVYLAALAINDTLFLLFHILMWMSTGWSLSAIDVPVVCETFAFLFMTTQYLAPTLVLGFTVERYIAVCYPYQKLRFCTTSRALKVVVVMIVACCLLSSVQPYLFTYDSVAKICSVRSNEDKKPIQLFTIWTWISEMLVFLAIPLLILSVNVLVMREVWRMSSSSPATSDSPRVSVGSTSARHSTSLAVQSVHGASTSTSKGAATNAMLLSVSFYIIFTTLPATLVYVLGDVIKESSWEPDSCLYLIGSDDMATENRFIVFAIVRQVINEVCMSHYACNFFLYVITGREFRAALRRTFCGRRRAGGSRHDNGLTLETRLTLDTDNNGHCVQHGVHDSARRTVGLMSLASGSGGRSAQALLARV